MIREFKINTTNDVENFLHYLVSLQGLNLGMRIHPDNAFEGYFHNGKRVFSDEEATILNQTMIECFNICEHNSVDIYEIAYKYVIAA